MDRYLNVEQVAELLSVKPKTIYSWAEHGVIPSYKFGSRVRFKESEVQEWAEGKRRETVKREQVEKVSEDILTKL